MQKAPAVAYPAGRSRLHLGVLTTAWSWVLALNAACWLGTEQTGWRAALLAALTLLCGLVALGLWRRTPVGDLVWDGATWRWETQGIRYTGDLRVQVDLQFSMLLHFSGGAGAWRWIWLDRSDAIPRWTALRRAVYAHGRTDPGTPILTRS